MFCNQCHSELPDREFYNGVKSRCKTCHKLRMKELRLTDPAVQERDRERAKQPKRKAAARVVTMNWRAKNPLAYKAHTAVNNAVRDGRFKRGPCVICGETSNVHAHHSDYSKPLTVRWLCPKCHHRLHASFPELRGHSQEELLR